MSFRRCGRDGDGDGDGQGRGRISRRPDAPEN
jgi:hypothetical protein